MVSPPSTIEQLAHDTVRTAEPGTALRALSALRQELEKVEPELVVRALQTGTTWSDIARALGVSKQAAHRKHRHLAEAGFDWLEARDKALVTGEARRAVALGRQEAERLGHEEMGTEHILLGILRCRGSHAAKALNVLGIDHDGALEVLRTTLPGVRPPGEKPAGRSRRGETAISAHARRILEGSLREAVRRGEGYIDVGHLLLALLADSRNGAIQTLEALRVTPKQIRRQLEAQWPVGSPSAPPSRGMSG